MTDRLRDDAVTLRCSTGLHDICSGCLCRCHDREPELPLDDLEGATP